MQQLQSLYRGDSSPSLAQIFGMQYQPQGATSQMANTALASGMSAGAQVKTTAMNNSTQMAIADANRFEQRRQFGLTNQLANRQQSEVERNNLATNAYNQGMLANSTRTTDFNTGGNTDIADNEAYQQVEAMVAQIDSHIASLSTSDPNYAAKVAALKARQRQIREQMNAARKSGRGGASGASKAIVPMLDTPLTKDGKPATGGVPGYVKGVNENVDTTIAAMPKAPAAPAAPAATPRKIVRLGTDAEGNEVYGAEGGPMPSSPGFKPFLNLPAGTNVTEAPASSATPPIASRPAGPLFPAPKSPTLSGVFNFNPTPAFNGPYRIGQGPVMGTGTIQQQAAAKPKKNWWEQD